MTAPASPNARADARSGPPAWAARPALACAALVCAALVGCDDRPETPRLGTPASADSPARVVETLGLDASLVDSEDPVGPAGDLKAELERFVNVDTCMRERANVDPLVGDALKAIGYDTFLRDACRALEASRDKRAEACERIDASPLRAQCRAWVAMIAQTPDACPLQFEGVPTRGRRITCVAVAARDPRLCAGEVSSARATCEALTTGDAARCGKGSGRAGCERELARWRSLLAPPLAALPALPASRWKLTVKGEAGTADPPTTTSDPTSELARGAVVVTSRERARVEVGMLGESEAARLPPSPIRRARLGLAIVLEPGVTSSDPMRPVLERLELEVPGEATVLAPPSRCDCTVSAHAARERGGEVTITVQGVVTGGARTYRVDSELTTFVRDVTKEEPGSRVLPPPHPASILPRRTSDAGAR